MGLFSKKAAPDNRPRVAAGPPSADVLEQRHDKALSEYTAAIDSVVRDVHERHDLLSNKKALIQQEQDRLDALKDKVILVTP